MYDKELEVDYTLVKLKTYHYSGDYIALYIKNIKDVIFLHEQRYDVFYMNPFKKQSYFLLAIFGGSRHRR